MAIANWKNQTIWTGDNLDIMRGMNSESVDLIYLDPPFNSNKSYSAPIGSEAAGAAFKDTWTLSDVDIAWVGLIAENEPCLPHVIDAAGIAHGKGMKAYVVMMAVRLIEMRRLLKLTGSIYLHCDPTASHYLKLVMDCVFGSGNVRNEIVWKRTPFAGSSKARAQQLPKSHDVILCYSKSEKRTWNPPMLPYTDEYRKRFRHTDTRGSYRKTLLKTYSQETLERLRTEDRLIEPVRPGAHYSYKQYLHESSGQRQLDDVWVDINMINPVAKERVGYPTQKPLALLNRIIEASTNEGDVVLDPFCGCATTCVSAHALGRLWAGIDISPKAAELIVYRLEQNRKNQQSHMMTLVDKVIHRTDIPKRTDVGKLPPYKTHKHTLYGMQEGRCKGCGHHFPFQNFTVDHIVPQSKGGTDHVENLQLLCNHCNSVKGTMDQAAFTAKLKNMGLGA